MIFPESDIPYHSDEEVDTTGQGEIADTNTADDMPFSYSTTNAIVPKALQSLEASSSTEVDTTSQGEIADTNTADDMPFSYSTTNAIVPKALQSLEASSSTELQELLKNMRIKYSGDASKSPCFPANPLRHQNHKYIEFDNLPVEERIGRNNWCRCTKCVVMPTNVESICCREIENAIPFTTGFNCITEHEFFYLFCNRADTVEIAMRAIGEVRRPPITKEKNRHLRKTAYRAFTAWIHGYLGIGNRRPIPSCVVTKVRGAFPDPDGSYVGFIPYNDPPAEFMAFEL